jgi:hypothetical protein
LGGGGRRIMARRQHRKVSAKQYLKNKLKIKRHAFTPSMEPQFNPQHCKNKGIYS